MKAAIFDLDGTLVDSLWFWEYYWREMGKKYYNDPDYCPPVEVDKAVRTMTMEQVGECLHTKCGMGENSAEVVAVSHAMLGDFYETSVKPKAGVLEFLAELKRRGVRICIASATVKSQIRIAMKSCGLEPYVEEVFSCADLGKGKDQPDIYLQAQQYCGFPIEESWIFEDSLLAAKTAKAAGFPVVGIFDPNNFGQEELAQIADHYIAEGETLEKLL